MPVHVLGNMCDMDRLMALAKKYCLEVIEDSTEALGSKYKEKGAGTFGTFGKTPTIENSHCHLPRYSSKMR